MTDPGDRKWATEPRRLQLPATSSKPDFDLSVEVAEHLERRDEAAATEALGRWRAQEGWPRRWVAPHPSAWTAGISIFAETCREWPWLALAMLEAGVDALQSEYGGVAALCGALRDRGRPDTENRVELVRRLIAAGVDVNGLGGPRVNWDGVSPLAHCLENYSLSSGGPLLAALLEAPGLVLEVQYWLWDEPKRVVSAARYAEDGHGAWALPQLEGAREDSSLRPPSPFDSVGCPRWPPGQVLLPRSYAGLPDLVELGFELGEPLEASGHIFVWATLPDGWQTKQADYNVKVLNAAGEFQLVVWAKVTHHEAGGAVLATKALSARFPRLAS